MGIKYDRMHTVDLLTDRGALGLSRKRLPSLYLVPVDTDLIINIRKHSR
jgi:hypothetical protein